VEEGLRAEAFVPGHISGFFQPFLRKNPLRSGSRNCGPCTEAGVRTEVVIRKSEKIEVRINRRRSGAPTSRWVVKRLLPEGWGATVNHTADVPIGAGFGASGAGALGAAMAIGSLLGLKREEVIAAAHWAEVVCRTGLGDVAAQACGGLVIGVRPGAPPHGMVKRIRIPGDVDIVCCTLGGIRTSSVLVEEEFISVARRLGGEAMRRILKSPSLVGFLRISRWFAEGLGLMDREIGEICEIAEGAGAIGASQAMLGRTVFAFCRPAETGRVRRALTDAGLSVLLTRISAEGGRVLRGQ
jgi:pantoate kinase